MLGLPHGLAVLHGKTRRGGLVFDIADLVKDVLILPQAFLAATRGDDSQGFRDACIDALLQAEALDFMIDTVKAFALELGQGWHEHPARLSVPIASFGSVLPNIHGIEALAGVVQPFLPRTSKLSAGHRLRRPHGHWPLELVAARTRLAWSLAIPGFPGMAGGGHQSEQIEIERCRPRARAMRDKISSDGFASPRSSCDT